MGKDIQISVSDNFGGALNSAMQSGKWMMAVFYVSAEGGTIYFSWETKDFPKDEIVPCIQHLQDDPDLKAQMTKGKKIVKTERVNWQ